MEILLEIIFQLVIEVGGAWLEHLYFQSKSSSSPHKPSNINLSRPPKYVIILLHLIGGGVIGLVSLYVLPETIFTRDYLKILSLIAGPLIVGAIMHYIGKRRTNYGKQVVSLENFYNGFTFAFGISLVRFLFAS